VFSESTINVTLKSHINNALSDTISQTRLLSYGVPNLQEMVNKANVDVDLKSVKWSESGSETESSTEMAMVLGMVLSLLTYTFVLMYGAMIMNGVIEEKTNRIVEVIVSSCKPFELMMGKIIGVALVGLTQLAIWGVIMGVLSLVLGSIFGADVMAGGQAQAGMQAMQEMGDSVDMAGILKAVMSINYTMIITNFIIYFVGGYLLYAALFAAFGSAVDQAADASQFTTPIILIMIVALYAGIACIENPNGPMAVWCSIIPFTSPVVMMVRLPYDVPFWQIALSVVLLYATACAVVWIAGRIYRTGILLYGKKTSFKEILRWIK
jgi:ABC-2 type transport system permease protein